MAGSQAIFDVGVVGAGPAGAWAAYRLARAGARVVVVDHSHPREKPCGGGVTGRALALVAEALDGAASAGVVVRRATFHRPGGPAAHVELAARGVSPASSLVVFDRRTFDGALLDAARRAGAEHIAERVTDVEADGTGVTLWTRRARVRVGRVVGADGANSLVRRRLARAFRRDQLTMAVGTFVPASGARDIVVCFVGRPAGYAWVFPRRDHLAVGICAEAGAARPDELREELTRSLEPLALGATWPGGTPYGWPIPSLDVCDLDAERPAGDRWLLAGDAAGLVDPITREGIFFALRSGELAAAALGAPGTPGRYIRALRHEIYPELRRAALLKRGFFRGAFTHLLVDALRNSARVRDTMADLVGGRQPYATLKRRLLATFEIGLAWRLLLLETRRHRDRPAPHRA